MKNTIWFKATSLCLILACQVAIGQEWVTWAQEKFQTGYFTEKKFNSKTFEASSIARDLPRKNLTPREEEKNQLMSDLFDKASSNLALLAIDRGQIVLERYKQGVGPQTKFFSWSMSKSLTAYTIGLSMCEKGVNNFNVPAEEIAPALTGTGFGRASITDILTMSSGAHNWSLDTKSGTIKDEWNDLFEYRRKDVLDILKAFDAKPKNVGIFAYKNSDTNSLPFLLNTPDDFLTAFQKYFIQPAGLAEESLWLRDKNGYVSAAGGYSATLRDWGRLAIHSLQILDGQHGECPKSFMKEATSAQIKNAAYGYDYGYQTWVHQRGPVFIWLGAYGQRAFLDKANHKVLILLRSSESDEFVTQVSRTYWAP
jgi:CubicO group peptidase (beta-lactamase class C family)